MAGKAHFHEDFSRKTGEEKSSERGLGIVFCVACAIMGLAKLYYGRDGSAYWLAAAVIFLMLAFFWQAPLKPINALWHRLGLLLFAATNPIIMAIIFYSTFVPTGLLMRALGKDPMQRRWDKDADSYWVRRTVPTPQHMKNQF